MSFREAVFGVSSKVADRMLELENDVARSRANNRDERELDALYRRIPEHVQDEIRRNR